MGALLEGFGINKADQGFDQIASGNIGKGILLVGLAVSENLPLGQGERVLFSGKKIGSGLARELGIGRRELGNRIESIKKAARLGGRENVIITNQGNVFDKRTNEFLDNLYNVTPIK